MKRTATGRGAACRGKTASTEAPGHDALIAPWPARPALTGFPPVLDARTETLILGSFPSPASLAAGRYYAHPRNQFWRLLGAVLGEPLTELPYARRLARVRAHRVGIWDVLAACDRAGSLDASIRNRRANDFARLRRLAPTLWRVVFNGGTAGRFARLFRAAGYATAVVPSSSPAHAGRSFDEKLALWRAALAPHGSVATASRLRRSRVPVRAAD